VDGGGLACTRANITPSEQTNAALDKTRAMNVLLVDHQMALEDEIYVAAKMKEAKDKSDQEVRDRAGKASPFGK
jgi:hypothetical protein